MKKVLVILFLILVSQSQVAQIRNIGRNSGGMNGLNDKQMDSITDEEISVKLSGKTKYTDYKALTYLNDTIVIDTTLTIKKEYKFNFLRKDNFELLAFHNQGQTFNNLAYDFSNLSIYPDIGFRAKQFNYYKTEDILYYSVPTPTSEIMARTAQEQGQVLNSLFTVNFNRRFNVSIAYKGLRSLGYYRNSLSSAGNFRSTLSYRTPKERYSVRAHFVKQDITNEESGGLTPQSLTYFVKDNPNFKRRGRLDTNLTDTKNLLKGSRFYVDHSFKLFSIKDTTNIKDFTNMKMGHEFSYEKKEYTFSQKTISDFFGASQVKEDPIDESVTSKMMNNQAYLEFNSKYILGKFKVKANYINFSYGYDKLLNITSNVDFITLRGDAVSGGANWQGKLGNFHLNTDAGITPGQGNLSGNHLKTEVYYKKDSLFTIKGRLSQVSKSPNFNAQLFQSVYNNYNWRNDFNNVATQNLGGSFLSEWANASLDFTSIVDYVYFDQSNKPKQNNEIITYFKVKADNEFSYRKFSLNNTIMYQEVTSGASVFRVPKFVTRNSLYYTDEWFKGKPLLVNIGLTFKYFTKYKMNAYNPMLAEFVLQDNTEIGYPTVDFFFNGRIRRARLFFKLNNISSFVSKRNYFSAPNYPYRDFSIRFGVVWNWFI